MSYDHADRLRSSVINVAVINKMSYKYRNNNKVELQTPNNRGIMKSAGAV